MARQCWTLHHRGVAAPEQRGQTQRGKTVHWIPLLNKADVSTSYGDPPFTFCHSGRINVDNVQLHTNGRSFSMLQTAFVWPPGASLLIGSGSAGTANNALMVLRCNVQNAFPRWRCAVWWGGLYRVRSVRAWVRRQVVANSAVLRLVSRARMCPCVLDCVISQLHLWKHDRVSPLVSS